MKQYKITKQDDILPILWETMDDLGISAYRLSYLTGISPATISRWKSGERNPLFYQMMYLLPFLKLEMRIIRKDELRDEDNPVCISEKQ